jgi:SsrA-binding protein
MKSISKNRKAYHEYFVEEKFEAGIVLKGSEVKSLRLSNTNLADSYAVSRNGEVWLLNLGIGALKHASYMNHNERREKKLLLKKRQIKHLDEATRQKGYTLIPLEMYFNDNQLVKVELGLCKGKAQYDKRETGKIADAKREIQRALRKNSK